MTEPDASAAVLGALPFPAALVDDRGGVLLANDELLRAGAEPGANLFELCGAIDGAAQARERFRDGALRGLLDDAVVLERAPGDDESGDGVRLHMRSLPIGAGAFALVVLTPLPGATTLERRIDSLEARLAAIGPVKHAIGNPLMGIVGYADLLRQRLAEADHLELIDKLTEQCARVRQELDRLDDLRYGRSLDDD